MTTYGTIPTSNSPDPPPLTNLHFISHAKHKIQSTYTTHRRPWNLLLSLSSLSLSLPSSFNDVVLRIKTNLSFFRMNYAIITLLILFCSLLWHPISLIVFLCTMSAWLFLYFLRDTPLFVFGYIVDDKIVLALLAVLTVVFLLLTDVTANIVVALSVAVAVIVVHAAVRRTDDLPLTVAGFDDESDARGGFSRGFGGLGERLPLKDTASSSFSASN
ncbi:PRA1 family protein F2-like [Chenopodium quinoa]|uniref:PRA1 family protein F2-like n=1 Tax=Chenopodium quinoa TaxID=63459 RepID=UPI000B79AF87|nr:PRA1 family protein F2-like [Chenopodium quinoa]